MEQEEMRSQTNLSDQQPECPVCMMPFHTYKRTPHYLPCLHTFCAPCIGQLSSRSARVEHMDSVDRKLSCPLCRALHTTLDKPYPTNWTIMAGLKQRCQCSKPSTAVTQARELSMCANCVGIETDIQGTVLKKDYNHVCLRNVTGKYGDQIGQFWHPWGLAVDPTTGNIIVTDHGNHRVQVFNADLQFLATFGEEGILKGQLRYPSGVAVDRRGQVIIADQFNHRLQAFDQQGGVLWTVGNKGHGPGQFSHPAGLTIDETGSIYVCDSGNKRVQLLDEHGEFVRILGGDGAGSGIFRGPPAHVAVLGNNSRQIIVTDGSDCIYVFKRCGEFVRDVSLSAELSHDATVAGSKDLNQGSENNYHLSGVTVVGNIVIVASEEGRIWTLDEEFKDVNKLKYLPSDLSLQEPQSLAVSTGGELIVSTWSDHQIRLFACT